jgi:hypothetical protein
MVCGVAISTSPPSFGATAGHDRALHRHAPGLRP